MGFAKVCQGCINVSLAQAGFYRERERQSDRARDEAFPEPFPNSTGCHDQGCIFYQGLPARLLSQPYPLPKHKYGGSESERLGECRESWGDTK